MAAVTLEQQHLVGHEFVADLHARATDWHAGYGEAYRLVRWIIKELSDSFARDMACDDATVFRSGCVTGVRSRLNAKLAF